MRLDFHPIGWFPDFSLRPQRTKSSVNQGVCVGISCMDLYWYADVTGYFTKHLFTYARWFHNTGFFYWTKQFSLVTCCICSQYTMPQRFIGYDINFNWKYPMEQHKVMIFWKSIVGIFVGNWGNIWVNISGNILGNISWNIWVNIWRNIFRVEFPLNILCHSSSLDMTSILIENLLKSGIMS